MVRTESYIEIVPVKPLPKMGRWEVRATQSGARLGYISWNGRKKQHVFEPDKGMEFDRYALWLIADFMTKEHPNYLPPRS